ncbi:HMG-I and HMG-Y [Halalkalibacter akibai JCM 9157]|uniref:HMG-I and HMG-Y n=1 Tax=Halalkalibacter akibai (strain ATCC 43226 / DSM 21942 / CIP 109018 / JCM 9157 / 1139) TaxID=1236973 RepID=W4R0A0_HALA3|nr:HMG-I and HMG-Y [Halalkalibacter akibai JCM 9157]
MEYIIEGIEQKTITLETQMDENMTLAVMSKKGQEYQERAWEVIQMIAFPDNEPKIFIAKQRRLLIREASAKFNISERTVSRYLKQFWKNGKTKSALYGKFANCGAKGKERYYTTKLDSSGEVAIRGFVVTEETKKIFRWALNKYYYVKGKPTLKFAYEQMVKEYFSKDIKEKNGVVIPVIDDRVPTLEQFRYFYKKENNIKREISKRYGSKKYELNNRAVLGSSMSEVMGPGSKYQIDGTSFDVYLISEYDGSIIGRPCLYYVQDVFSRLVTGVYIGLETSWVSIMMAIANVAEDKVDYCKKYGIEITEEEWSVHHLPECILGDRGELFSKKAEAMISELGIRVENTTSYRGDLKGILERHFRTTNDYVKMIIPGTIDVDFRSRGARDYRLDAKLNLKQFTAIIIRCILYHNNQHYLKNYNREVMMIEDQVNAIPLDLWNWGIKNRSGRLKALDYEKVLLNMMPIKDCTVTYSGIKFMGMYYSCDTAHQEHWFQRARNNGSWKVTVSYDPRDVSKIYIREIGAKGYEPAYLLNHQSRYLGKSIEEIRFLNELEKQLYKEQQHSELQAKVELNVQIEEIVREAEMNVKPNENSNRKQISNIRNNRLFEKGEARNIEKFDLNEESQSSMNKNQVLEAKDSYFDDFDLLWNKQKEHQPMESRSYDRVNIVQAEYKEQVIFEYMGNPLTEALPNIMSREEVISSLSNYPNFNPCERELDSHYRLHLIQRIFQYYQPLPIHLDLESRISRLIRQGYINRNPLQRDFVRSFFQGREDIENNEITSFATDNSSGLTIVGTSGMGKTATTTKLFELLPQVIIHSNYRNQHFILSQIVWLKLECPYDGSIKGLCLNFLMEVDRLLNTNYYQKFGKSGRLSATALLPVVAQISRNCSIGFLAIDEIQHLSLARSGGAEKMLNFFVTLQNAIGIPVILIGTHKSLAILQSEFRQARRSSGTQGEVIWNQLKKDEPSWDLFLKGMWKYQWIKKPVELTGELNNAMFEVSQGIIDIAKKLFVSVQVRSITSGTETFTTRTIHEVFKEYFKIIQPMLIALRTNNMKKIAQYGDIAPVNIDQFISNEQSKIQLEETAKWIQYEEASNKQTLEKLKGEVVIRLSIIGIDKSEAQKAVDKCVDEGDVKKQLGDVVKKVFVFMTNGEVKSEKVTEEEFDLRLLVKEGMSDGLTAYRALKDKGYIKEDFLLGGD